MSMVVPKKVRPLCIPAAGTTGYSSKPDFLSGNELDILACPYL